MFSRNRHRDYQPVGDLAHDHAEEPLLESFELEEGHEKPPPRPPVTPRSIIYYLCLNPTRLCGLGRGRWKRLIVRCILFFFIASLMLLFITPIFNPSYSIRPAHYKGNNPHNEKVFIAANIIDEDMIRGPWGNAVKNLVELIGPDNVYLSIYENDSGDGVKNALHELSAVVKCRSNIISGHIDLDKFPRIQILPNDSRIKRLSYLAQVRNHAIEPIEYTNATTSTSTITKFDKLLFLNDVVFSPRDAADLLFATGVSTTGRTTYHAACAMDYINPLKFYDRFAMRDHEYYEAGLPFFPWFVNGGRNADSFHDVMAMSDSVRVKSCWGGMVAFEAKWFRQQDLPQKPERELKALRFRSEPDAFWDASECCLIHADLEALVTDSHLGTQARIFVNPYIRTAYDANTFSWLEFTRRFERLFTVPHMLIGWLLRQPWAAVRRNDPVGRTISRREWTYQAPARPPPKDQKFGIADIPQFGRWETVQRQATPGGWCGFPFLLALKNEYKPGERRWEKIFEPPGANRPAFT
ncbi:hypothetical protein BT63DRAFT_426973 [Microthyrium microscopicum]|uniref:Glycosyltransferase family 69 protein n=1 Tax=Microthyrium microscopicum TaxID=703497 RepID=A0A6A6U502_9PEZI|nr:hypothetical protein BT63DRAFT_426973 [Microthyrium microscopicum]